MKDKFDQYTYSSYKIITILGNTKIKKKKKGM